MALKDEYYTLSEFASMVGVTRQTVSRWFKEGKIVGERVGREVLIPQTELDKFDSKLGYDIVEWLLRAIAKAIRKGFKYSKEDKIEYILDSHRYDEEHDEGAVSFSVTSKDGSYSEIQVRFSFSEEEPIMTIKMERIEEEKKGK